MRSLTVASVQMAMVAERDANVDAAEAHIREAAAQGAQVVLIPELFEGPYFCIDQRPEHLLRAAPLDGHPTIDRFRALAAELGIVLPCNVYEQAGNARFNTVAMIDADGTVLGTYRKSHIPDGPGYTEKYYFSPGDTGFRAWRTAHGTIGIAICWDQWFPEAARAMALAGAEVLLYPTAIGSEPPDPTWDSSGHWHRVMVGHSAANLVPVVASNRWGHEVGVDGEREITFYGSSFITDHTGATVAEAPRDADAVLTATFDLDQLAADRAGWGLFRDRRPDLYGPLLTLDGQHPHPGATR